MNKPSLQMANGVAGAGYGGPYLIHDLYKCPVSTRHSSEGTAEPVRTFGFPPEIRAATI